MTLARRYTRTIDNFLKVTEVFTAIGAVWRVTGALFAITLTCFLGLAPPVIFIFPVSDGLLFLISVRRATAICCICYFLPSFFLRRRLLNFESWGQFALLNQALLQQVIHCGHLVVLVTIQTLSCIVFLETIAFKISEKWGLDRDLVLTNDESLALANGLVCLIPGVLLNLICSQALVRVRFKNLVNEVNTFSREAFGHLELAA